MREVSSPGCLTAMPSASVSPPKRQVAALDCALHRRIKLSLDTDQLDVRLDRARRDRHAGHEPAAPDRNDDRVELAARPRAFRAPTVPGAGDDLRIVERVDEDIALLERELARLGVGVVEHRAVKHDVRAMARGLRHFHRRRRLPA